MMTATRKRAITGALAAGTTAGTIAPSPLTTSGTKPPPTRPPADTHGHAGADDPARPQAET